MSYLSETSLHLERELRNYFQKYLKEISQPVLIRRTHTIGRSFLGTRTRKHIWNDAMWYINLHVRVVIPIFSLDNSKKFEMSP